MNVAIWIVQVLIGIAFILGGFNHGFRIEQAREQIPWMKDLSRPILRFIGTAEILGGIGVIMPSVTGVLPWLTPLAAALLALVMLLAAGFHARRGEYPAIVINLVLLALAAFVAYGRYALVRL